MRLNKSDALLIHAVLFRHACENDSDSRVEDLLADLEGFIVSSAASDSDESDDEVEVDADEDETAESDYDLPDADEQITSFTLSDLPVLNVTSPTGEKVSFEFEDVGAEDSIDVLIDDATIIIDGIQRVKVTAGQIELFDSSERHVFGIKKLPKTWAKVFKTDVVYGISLEEEEE
jgi:hypothetical protein